MYRRTSLPYWRPRYRSSDMQAADYGILSVSPPIFYVPYWIDEQLVLHQSLTRLFDYLANTRAYFLYISWMKRFFCRYRTFPSCGKLSKIRLLG
jgi:hypothetical protein